MPTDSDVELILGSRTQTAEAIQKVLADAGYEDVSLNTQTDMPAEETPVVEGTQAEPIPPAPAAGAEEQTPGSAEGEAAVPGTEAEAVPHPAADKPKGGFKKKISKLERENEELRRQLAEKSAEPAGGREPERPVAVPPVTEKLEPKARPTEDDEDADGNPKYADLSAYNEALIDWKLEERERLKAEKAQTEQASRVQGEAEARAKAERDAEARSWQEQTDEAKTLYRDFETVMQESAKMPAAIPLTEAIKDSDLSARLVYYLATNPAELKRLNDLVDLPQDAPQREFRKKLKLAHLEVTELEKRIAAEPVAEDPEELAEVDDEIPETESAAPSSAPPAQRTDASREARGAAAPIPPAAPAAAPPKGKSEPPRPVGNRGVLARKRIEDMTTEELRALPNDEYRKLRGM